jgi:hypothetical protein
LSAWDAEFEVVHDKECQRFGTAGLVEPITFDNYL